MCNTVKILPFWQFFYNVSFYANTPKYQGLKKNYSRLVIYSHMKALIWLKTSNLALLGILVKLVQKLNQNDRVKQLI